MAVNRDATDAVAIRHEALESLKLHNAGSHKEALSRAMDLARAHPGSALALNLAGTLHRHAAVAAWTSRSPGDEATASALEWSHHTASLGAFSAAVNLAPKCLVTALSKAKALAACHRYGDAQIQLCRALTMTDADQDDPAVHNIHCNVSCASTEKMRKQEGMAEARFFMKRFANMICNDVMPREAVKLLDANSLVGTAGAKTRERAEFMSLFYPYSGRAQLLRAHIDLAQVRAFDLGTNKKTLLRRILAMVSEAAGTFHNSLVIALFHAKLLFVLDDYDSAEGECRRALGIETPNDPSEDDIFPHSVSGADYDERVCNVRKEIRALLKQIIVVAAKFWCSMISAHQQDDAISLKADSLHGYYDTFDQSAANTIFDALQYVKKHSSWTFCVCPHSHCNAMKFNNTETLLQHMCKEHPGELWEKLRLILGSELYGEDDHTLDRIALCKDSSERDIFRLPKMKDMFESLLSVGIVQAQSIDGMRESKCRQGSEILEIIKEKLRMLPEDVSSTQFEGGCFGIRSLWLEFLKISVVDYREVVSPLATAFQWVEVKRMIAHAVNQHDRSIGDRDIDALFGKLLGAPDRNVSVENGSIPYIGHQNGDNLHTDNLKVLCNKEIISEGFGIKEPTTCGDKLDAQSLQIVEVKSIADDKCRQVDPLFVSTPEFSTLVLHSVTAERENQHTLREVIKSEVHEDRDSSNIANQRSSGPPIENGTNLAEGTTDSELYKNGTSVHSIEEKAGTASNQPSVDVFNETYADNDPFIFHMMIQSLCNLRIYREKFLKVPLLWTESVENPWIDHICPEICNSPTINNDMIESRPGNKFENKHMCNIYVDTTVGRIRIEVNLDDTCISLKQTIQKRIGYPIDRCNLRFGGYILDDMKTLKSYGMRDNSVLDLQPKLLGGAEPPAQEPELQKFRAYHRGNVQLVETFQIPSTQTPNMTQDTDELTGLGRRLGRSLIDPFVAAWRNKLSYNGKVKNKNIRIRDGRVEITKEPTDALTRLNWKNDCNTLAALLRAAFLKNNKNPPYMDDLIHELETADRSLYNKNWFRIFIRFNLALKSSLCRGHVSYDIMRMYDKLSGRGKAKFQARLNSVKVDVWTKGIAQVNYIFKPTCDYRVLHHHKAYAKTGFACFSFQRNYDTHGKYPWEYAEIPIPAILGNFVSQAIKELLEGSYSLENILQDE